MSGSGALGRGSFYSVIGGTQQQFRPTYYPSAYELLQLHRTHLQVLNHFSVRDRIIDNKFPGCSFANGLFKLGPIKRENYHMKDVMRIIRKRSILISRINNQRAINNQIIEHANNKLTPEQVKRRFSFQTPDSDAYFNPQRYTTANNWPNYWQHPTQRHVIPRPSWRRVPELDNITRVEDPLTSQLALDY